VLCRVAPCRAVSCQVMSCRVVLCVLLRRDGCPAVSKMLEACLRLLFSSKDLSAVKDYCTRQWAKILSNRVSVQVRGAAAAAAAAAVAATTAALGPVPCTTHAMLVHQPSMQHCLTVGPLDS
jgi:hypothetical protein